MNTSRDKKTNLILSAICNFLDSSEIEDFAFPVTLVVCGQIITGLAISEKEFINLESNEMLKPIYDLAREERRQFLNDDGSLVNPNLTQDEISKIPDDIWQRFMYLKDARYMSGNTYTPSEGAQGSAIQVRISDVVAFNCGTFTSINKKQPNLQ